MTAPGSGRPDAAPASADPAVGEATSSRALRVGVVGARVAVQGTGPYVARAFGTAGCDVVGIVGTRAETVEAARRDLGERYGLAPRGYLTLPALLEAEAPDVVAICSPAPTHRTLLDCAAESGVHVPCEKPLFREPDPATLPRSTLVARAWELVDRFRAAGRLLALDTQWPRTLPAYRDLYPALGDRPVTHLEMRLSPISRGVEQVVDAAPHLLSLLFALAGPGSVDKAVAEPLAGPAPGPRARPARGSGADPAGGSTDEGTAGSAAAEGWRLGFDYLPRTGGRHAVRAVLTLLRCPHQPRPAAYAMELVATEGPPGAFEAPEPAGRAVPLPDPLDAQVADFVAGVRAGRATDTEALVESLALLRDLVRAAAGGPGAHQEQT